MAYNYGNEVPCMRDSNILILPGLPEDITEDDLFTEFNAFGVIRSIEKNASLGVANICFSNAREACNAERYVLKPFMSSPGMANTISDPMNAYAPMASPYGGPLCGSMGVPMVGSMSVPMMGSMQDMMGVPMMGGGMMSPQYSWPQQRMKSPVASDSVTASMIRITSKADGSRQFFSPPGNQNVSTMPSTDDHMRDPTIERGQCSRCSKNTSYTCGRCGAFYCSSECQKQDWSMHQTSCNSSIPPLNYAGKSRVVEDGASPSDQRNAHAQSWNQRHPSGPSSTAAGAHNPRRIFNSSNNESQSGRWNQKHAPQGNDQLANNCEQMNGRTSSSSTGQRSFNHHGQRSNNFSNSAGDDKRNWRPSSEKQGFGPRSNASPKQGDFHGSRRGNFTKDDGNDRAFEPKKLLTKPSASVKIDNDKESLENGALSEKERSPPSSQASPKGVPSLTTSMSALDLNPPKAEEAVASLPKTKEESSVTKTVIETKSSPKPETTSVSLPKTKKEETVVVPDISLPTPPSTRKDTIAEVTGKSQQTSVEARVQLPPVVSIPNGGLVVLTYLKDNFIYLRPADETTLKEVQSMESRLATYCASAACLDRQPKKKEFVAAKFSVDGLFYRAVVENKPVKSEPKYEVRFVDYGNTDSGVSPQEMIPLPDDIAEVSCMSVQTFLKGLKDIPFSDKAVGILNTHFSLEHRFTVEYGTDVTLGVKLKDEQGESLNEKLLAAMGLASSPAPTPAAAQSPSTPPVQPSSKTVTVSPALSPLQAAARSPNANPEPSPAVNNSRKFLLDDLKSFDLAPIGTEAEVAIQHVYEEGGMLMVSPIDADIFQKITDMSDAIETYARTAKPFRPEANELCVAKWNEDGGWYRGACVESSGDSFTIMFLEYGNTDVVQYPNIVPYTEALQQIPALSTVCFLSGPSLTQEQKVKLSSMYNDNKNNWVVKATVIKKTEDSCLIDCPSIRNQL